MNANGSAQSGVPPRSGGGGAPAPSPDDTLADLVRDRAVVVAALLDAGSGMLLASRSRDGAPEDLETVCAGQADVIRAALDAARVSIGGPEPTEVVVAHGDRLHQLLRTVHDPLGDRLVLSLLVDGPPRALRRVRRRLGRLDAMALVPLPHRGGLPDAAPPQPPAAVGADLFTPAHPGAQGPWFVGDGVRAVGMPGPPSSWGAPAGGGPAGPAGPVAPPGAPGGFSAEVIGSAIEATVRIAARAAPGTDNGAGGGSPAAARTATAGAAPEGSSPSRLTAPPRMPAADQVEPTRVPSMGPTPAATAERAVAERPSTERAVAERPTAERAGTERPGGEHAGAGSRNAEAPERAADTADPAPPRTAPSQTIPPPQTIPAPDAQPFPGQTVGPVERPPSDGDPATMALPVVGPSPGGVGTQPGATGLGSDPAALPTRVAPAASLPARSFPAPSPPEPPLSGPSLSGLSFSGPLRSGPSLPGPASATSARSTRPAPAQPVLPAAAPAGPTDYSSSTPAAPVAMPVAPARAAVASAVPPIAAAASPVPAVPVAMPTRPAQPAPAPPGDLAAAAAPDGPPPSTATVPGGPGYEGAAPDLHQDGDPDDRPTPSGRAAGWSTASVLGRGVGPGGAAPAATDVVAALDRAGTVAGLSGSALFTGLVPPEPPSPVDDLPPATTWADEVPAADPAPAVGDDTSPADPGPTEGSEPHPWFGAGRHSRPEGAPSSPVTGAPGPGRHTSTPATAPVPPSPPQQPRPADPTASAVHPVAERPRPVPHPRAAQAPVDRVVAAALQGVGAAVPQPAPWASPSLFEPPGPRDRDDLTERAEDPTGSTTPPIPGARSAPDAATPPAAGRDGGNPVDPGR